MPRAPPISSMAEAAASPSSRAARSAPLRCVPKRSACNIPAGRASTATTSAPAGRSASRYSPPRARREWRQGFVCVCIGAKRAEEFPAMDPRCRARAAGERAAAARRRHRRRYRPAARLDRLHVPHRHRGKRLGAHSAAVVRRYFRADHRSRPGRLVPVSVRFHPIVSRCRDVAAADAPDAGRAGHAHPAVRILFLAIGLPGLFVTIVKRLIDRARPYVGSPDNPFVYRPFAWAPEYASMPSGHATTAASAAIAIGALWPKSRPVMWLYALVIMFSRVVVLAHHPSDVIAGALVGAGGALWLRRAFAARGLLFSATDLKAFPGPSWPRVKAALHEVLRKKPEISKG